MKAFWNEMRERVAELSRRDEQCALSFGAKTHEYRVGPLVSNRVIRGYEKKHSAEIPTNYRAYLEHFGSGGAGPNLGLSKFPDQISQGDLTEILDLNHLNLQVSQGFIEVDETEDQLYECHGMLEIGSAGEALNYLVVSGPLQGNVLCWMEGQGMLGVRGSFDQWYKNWVDRMFNGLQDIAILNKIEVGMPLSEVEAIPGIKACDKYNNGFLYLNFTNWYMKIGSDNRVEKLYFDDYPLF